MRIALKSERLSVARLARVLSVMAIAMAAGHLAQALAVRKPVRESNLTHSQPTDIVLLSAESQVAPLSALAEPARAPTLPAMEAALTLPEAPLTVAEPALAQTATCAMDLALDAEEGAMMDVIVVAPCHAGERVVLRHAGLAVTGRLDAEGMLAIDLPALLADARLEVLFADGNTVEGALMIEEALALRRFGVQWQGAEAFAVHGFENGADFGQPGHVSALNPGRSLVVLGDASVEVPLLAQVYTYPLHDKPVEVLVEAAVTPQTCGQELLGEVIAMQDGRVEVTELTLAMPECSGVGDFLVLKNLPSKMTLAAN